MNHFHESTSLNDLIAQMLKKSIHTWAFELFIPYELTYCIVLHLHSSKYPGFIDKQESRLHLLYFFVFLDLVLKDKIVVYDLARQRIGWTDYDCKYPLLISEINVGMTCSFPPNLFSIHNVLFVTNVFVIIGSSSVNVSITSGKGEFINAGQLSVNGASGGALFNLQHTRTSALLLLLVLVIGFPF